MMSPKEQENLIKFGEEIDILVTPTIIDGKRAIAYCDMITADPVRANRDLLILSFQVCVRR
ncbi:MAG TPA: hypothetical protein VF974_08140 [Patescibacteria group bacterium]